MTTEERRKKLGNLPWQALFDFALGKGIDASDISNKDKSEIIQKICATGQLTDAEVEELINDYIYGNRITFTLWTFANALSENDYQKVYGLEGSSEYFLDIVGFRNLQILSVKKCEDRVEILYVYGKEYDFVDEDGHDASVWEQHRGCLWIGLESTYLACISKHDKMTAFITKYIAEKIDNVIRQIKPPKKAINRCVNPIAISRVVFQGIGGEKTVISNSAGLTEDQEQEMDRVRIGRYDTSGSYIAAVTEEINATIKYNVSRGSIGIYKHISSEVLFAWSKEAINIIFEEIESLKGRSAEEIFRELGREIKWTGLTVNEEIQMNWFLTQAINVLNEDNEFSVQIPDEYKSILENKNFFMKVPRIFCKECDSYEMPLCENCNQPLKMDSEGFCTCECGAPVKVCCSEGHSNYIVEPWYVPTKKFFSSIDKHIKYVYPDEELNYHWCIIGDNLSIAKGNLEDGQVEILFDDIECFGENKGIYNPSDESMRFAVRLNEKCSGGCTRTKVNKCVTDSSMVCLPKLFYNVLPTFRPQPHKGGEYGDICDNIKVGSVYYEMKGIIKKNSMNKGNHTDDELLATYLLSSSKEGEEIIRQFVEQGMNDSRCQVVAVVAPQYFDNGLKGTLRYLAKLGKRKVVFIGLNEVCKLIDINKNINIP